MTSAADGVIVNLLLIACSLPVITAGAALAAAHGALTEVARDESTQIVRSFGRHLRTAWRAATVGWLVVLGVGGFLVWEYWALGRMEGWGALVAQATVLTGAILLLIWALWFFPTTVRERRFFAAARRAAVLGIGHLPRSLVAVVIVALPALFLLVNPTGWAAWLAFMVIIGPALVVYLIVLLQGKILDQTSDRRVGEAPAADSPPA